MKATYLRFSLVTGAIVLFFGPWVYALLAVAADPKSGRIEDGPATLATYVSFLTLPVSVVMVVFAFVLVKPKRD